MGIPTSIGDGYACDCGAKTGEQCKQGFACRAVRLTTAIRQQQSAAARHNESARQAVVGSEARDDHKLFYSHIYERLAVCGIDPFDLAEFLRTLPPRG